MSFVPNSIAVSIASYRDPDLINTVRSAYDNAFDKKKLFFSILSQASESEHPDLSFIPENQIRYKTCDWSESKGACWARAITTHDLNQDFFLQIDSHSRFKQDWDKLIINNYYNAVQFWGTRIILTNYPDPMNIENNVAKFTDLDTLQKLVPIWSTEQNMIISNWADVVDTAYGDEQFFLSANCFFAKTGIQKEIPYDEKLYFSGEEPSLAIRAYTRGIRLISPTVKFMYHAYDRGYRDSFHWVDHEKWWELNNLSYQRLDKFFDGDLSLGIYGIGSMSLYKQYQKVTGIDLENRKNLA